MIAIVGILISLLLPAVEQARESSRRIHCANNLKQLVIAMQNYEGTYRELPAAGRFGKPENVLFVSYGVRVDLKSGTNFSWVTSLLPFLEEEPLYDQFDFTRHISENTRDPQGHQPPSLLCPSDSSRGRFFEMPSATGDRIVAFGKANYAAWTNPFHVDSWFYSGAMRLYGQRLEQVTDGLSSTLVFGEIRTRDHPLDQRGAWALPWSAASLLAFDMHPTSTRTAPGGESNTDKQLLLGYQPFPGSFGLTQRPNSAQPDVLYQCPDMAETQLDRMPCNTAWRGYISAAPRSMHVGGANAAFLDGHVAFLPDDIDELSMVYMVFTTDGEQIEKRY
ncbi:MAG: DUF1559 domain-containing protein [Planctomycetes bacterium]|nr:DUF1559 domain-containing protein [Planctomycetota bacterium]